MKKLFLFVAVASLMTACDSAPESTNNASENATTEATATEAAATENATELVKDTIAFDND